MLPGWVPQPADGPRGTSPPLLSGSLLSELETACVSLALGSPVVLGASVVAIGASSSVPGVDALAVSSPLPSAVPEAGGSFGAAAHAAPALIAANIEKARNTGRDIARTIARASPGAHRGRFTQVRPTCHAAGMKAYVGYVLLALSLVVAYQGWNNSREEQVTQDMARGVTCQVQADCRRTEEKPNVIRHDAFARRYQFQTTVGPVGVTCRRAWMFFGGWSCVSAIGSL
jgi:hypothetical protein